MVFFAGLEAGPIVEMGIPSSQWPLNECGASTRPRSLAGEG